MGNRKLVTGLLNRRTDFYMAYCEIKRTWTAILLSSALMITGCSEQWVEIEEYGVFVLSKHFEKNRLDWEGGNRRIWKTTFCRRDTSFCLEDRSVHVSESEGRALKVVDRNRAYLFDKFTGDPIRCVNCGNEDNYNEVLNNSLRWNGFGSRALVTNTNTFPTNLRISEENNRRSYRIWILDILPEGAYLKEVSPAGEGYSKGEPRNIVFSPDTDSIAWHLCTPNCSLWQFDIQEEIYTETKLPCDYRQYNTYWDIVWNSDRAVTQHYWGVTNSQLCLGDDGQPAFPVQPRS